MTKYHCSFPDIFVVSKFPNLERELRKVLPEKVNLVKVELADKSIRWDKGVKLEPEEIKVIQNAKILVMDGMLLAKMVHDLPNASWVQLTWAGADMVFQELDSTKSLPQYKVTRFVDEYYEELMSNYVIAQIINIERCFYDLHDAQKLKQWARPYFPGSRIMSELTIGVLGAGRLGISVATLLVKSGATVLSFVRSNKHIAKDSKHKFVRDLNDILEDCDYICNVLPSTSETFGLLNGDTLKKCKKKPVFINVGRGDIINEDTIIEALSKGWISKAVLDVYEKEPLSSDSPLWTMPNVILTPHIGAMPRVSSCAEFIGKNYQRFVSGENLLNEIDWNKGY